MRLRGILHQLALVVGTQKTQKMLDVRTGVTRRRGPTLVHSNKLVVVAAWNRAEAATDSDIALIQLAY